MEKTYLKKNLKISKLTLWPKETLLRKPFTPGPLITNLDFLLSY
jgi:hypothetical protein